MMNGIAWRVPDHVQVMAVSCPGVEVSDVIVSHVMLGFWVYAFHECVFLVNRVTAAIDVFAHYVLV